MPPRKKDKGTGSFEGSYRLHAAQTLLGRAAGATLKDMMSELGVERATALRYLDALGQQGFVIETIGKQGRAKIHRIASSPSYSIAFTFEEAAWLAVISDSIDAFRGTGIDEALKRVSAKVEAKLRPDDRAKVAALRKKVFTVPDHAHDYAGKKGLIDELIAGLVQDRPVMITQTSRRSGEARAIRFDPFTLVTHKRALYVVGKSHGHQGETRTFLIDGIDAAAMMKDALFVRPDDFDPATYFEGSFGMHRGEEETKVVLRFDKSVAPSLRPRKWHPTQVLEERDGYVWLTMRPKGTTEIVSWALSWGDKVTVMEPKDLRDAWIKQLEGALQGARA